MKTKRFCVLFALFFTGISAFSRAVVIDFESMPLGTLFGSVAGDVPGDVVFTQEGVEMSVQNFILGDYVGFLKAEIGSKFDPFFPTTPLGLENISVMFDFTNMSKPITSVALEYLEFGGDNNFSVNGHTLFQVNDLTDLPTNIAPGVTLTVTSDQIFLNGVIENFLIGGQELAIDNTNAVPEPFTGILLILGAMTCIPRRGASKTEGLFATA